MKKTYVLLIFIVLSFPHFSFAEEKINNFSVEVRLNNDATINVTENIVYDYDNLQSGKERHGLYRDIPYKYQAGYGTFNFDFSDESVNTDNFEFYNYGKYLRIDTNPNPDIHVSGVNTYLFKYKVDGAIGYFNDFDEIYWNATGNEWDVPIEDALVQIILPKPLSESLLKISCYNGIGGSKEICPHQLGTNNNLVESVTFYPSRSLSPREGITVAVGFPKGIVYEPTAAEKIFKAIWNNKIFLLPILVFLVMSYLWYTKGRDPKGTGVIIPQYDVPNGLSPMEIDAIYSEKIRPQSISAEIINLAIKGFLKIEKQEKSGFFGSEDYIFRNVNKMEKAGINEQEILLLNSLFNFGVDKDDLDDYEISEEGLKKMEEKAEEIKTKELSGKELNFFERKFLDFADLNKQNKATEDVEGRREVKLSSLKDKFYRKVNRISKNVISSLVKANYYERSPETVKNNYLLISIPLFFVSFFMIDLFGSSFTVASIISSGIIFAFSFIMPKKTEKGMAVYEYILGLKDYLQIAEKDRINFHNAPEKKPEIFEKLLPYAMVLGVEKAWAKEFEGIYTTPPNWYSDTHGGAFNAIAFTNSINSFGSSASSTLTSAPGGSSGSGGGGSSGGGGGGGGGGSH